VAWPRAFSHNLGSTAAPHWHVDYLLAWASPLEVWYAIADRKLEHDWAELFQQARQLRAPISRFGSSDYRRSQTSHLFYSKRRPSFRWFQEQVQEIFAPAIQPQQYILADTQMQEMDWP